MSGLLKQGVTTMGFFSFSGRAALKFKLNGTAFGVAQTELQVIRVQ